MQQAIIKSFAKINLSLGVISKSKDNLHKIESLITFIDLYDEIKIKKTNKPNHKVIFYGRFSKDITSNNTVNNLLKFLEKKNFLKTQKFIIEVKKNIPVKSGLGGGSMNAASILSYFKKKKIITINKIETVKICKHIGSDVELGIEKKNPIIKKNSILVRVKNKFKLYLLVVKPKLGCSTSLIYKGVKNFSKPKLNIAKKKLFRLDNIKKLSNDLEIIATKKYPVLASIKKSMENIKDIKLVRMTGSGACMVGYFNNKKSSLNALKIFKKKYTKYWCIQSKTI